MDIIAVRLYSDVLRSLEEIKFSIGNGDRREALIEVSRLIESLVNE